MSGTFVQNFDRGQTLADFFKVFTIELSHSRGPLRLGRRDPLDV